LIALLRSLRPWHKLDPWDRTEIRMIGGVAVIVVGVLKLWEKIKERRGRGK